VIAPKHCALAAAGGFVLSVLIGLVRGNFGSLMFVRALVCGLVVGLVCLGVYVVFTFVLGLGDGTATGAPGASVDISVDDEGFFGGDEDATFNLGNLMNDDAAQSSQFEEARAAINLAVADGDAGTDDATTEFGRTERSKQEKTVPAEADKPVFTAAPLATKEQTQGPDLGNLGSMDPTVAAKTIQALLRSEK
jgi:hypothetical protein